MGFKQISKLIATSYAIKLRVKESKVCPSVRIVCEDLQKPSPGSKGEVCVYAMRNPTKEKQKKYAIQLVAAKSEYAPNALVSSLERMNRRNVDFDVVGIKS
jgi:hypothetical protein